MNRSIQTTELLLIGAGPYNLAIAAHAKAAGINTIIVGEPMGFWRRNMPAGMFLRSGLGWHLDASGIHTIEAFLEEEHIPRELSEPMPIETFLEYAHWFRVATKIEAQPLRVSRLCPVNGEFEACCESGALIRARRVVAAPGLSPFTHIPSELPASLPARLVSHTAALVDFRLLAGKSCLILGGRQSAFEWAALMMETGIESVDIVFRHETPAFITSDWSFTDEMVENTLRVRGWFRHLRLADQQAIHKRFWGVGRLQLEPWLWPRVNRKNVRLWPNAQVISWRETPVGGIEARLDVGKVLFADHVICATGYKVDMSRLTYLAESVASSTLRVTDGFPVLDEDFQTTLPGLYIVGQPSMLSFGPFFGFVRGCVASARIVVAALQRSAA